jgi:hypothetical protein
MTGQQVDHPLATNVLVWGILSVCCCGAVGGPIAWIRGRRVLREIAASGGAVGGRSATLVGYVLGIVSTLYSVVFILGAVAYIVITRTP